MGSKKINQFLFNWDDAPNANPVVPNAPLSGDTEGVMTATDVIYTNTQDISNFDNCGLVVTYTGDADGEIEVFVANLADDEFYALTFDPALAQPSGASGGYVININQIPFRYMYLKYTNSTGDGVIRVSISSKDLN